MSLKDKIIDLIKEPIESAGFDLVEIKLAQYRNKYRLQIFVDSDNGVVIENCIAITRLLDPILEESDFFRAGYTIDVSSPGLDRPLVDSKNFKRRIGEQVKLMFVDDKPAPVEGKLTEVRDEKIVLIIDDAEQVFDLDNIRVGKIIF